MYKVGDIVEVKFGFTSKTGIKSRPSVIIDLHRADCIVIFMTKEVHKYKNEDTSIIITNDNLEQGKLKTTSILRLHKQEAVLKDNITIKLGRLNRKTMALLLKKLTFIDTQRHYYAVHHPAQTTPFVPGQSRINYAGRVYDEREMLNLVDSALDFWLTAGRFEREFTAKLAGFLGAKHIITTNSGSSANLLAIAALTSPKLGDRRLKRGDEVITVAAAFPTTVAPIIQHGLVPVFVDLDLGTYNVNVQQLEAAISKRTKAIFLAHTMGIPFDLDQVLAIARRYNLWLIEDNCDALGAKWDGKYTGTFGHLATLSFYPAHHITMGEGGAVNTDDTQLKQLVTSFRDWGRDCWCDPGKDNTCGKRFEQQLGTLPFGYDHKYVYSHLGYNLKITDMQAAVGLAQLDKLPAFIEKRQQNWQRLYQGLKELEEVFILPVIPPRAEASPFGFVLTIKNGAPFNRQQITNFLEGRNIQTRTVFAGNILRQPAFTESAAPYRIAGELKNTDKVMTDTFWIGVYPGLTAEMLDYMIERIREFVREKAW
ncbi:lipopolysaccharide biosynthesis protein RfbH [Dehalococcoidia bacterium]|nr:lipopolysaccharide biosynthesis protein RfbH [Dehalococcoidia bacterium]